MIDVTRNADLVAPELLGCVVTFHGVSVRLTEVEAYLGAEDAAAHTYRGRTPRNATMFGPPGRLYVYLSYGIHMAGNIVCAPEGVGQGCLLRAGEVVAGLNRLSTPRGRPLSSVWPPVPAIWARRWVCRWRQRRHHAEVPEVAPEWVAGPRIGISKNVDAPLRF